MTQVYTERARITDPNVLSRYLPDRVIQYLLEPTTPPPPDIDLGQHIARLQELLQYIVSYVPEYADVGWRALPTAKPGALARAHGTLLAADLSGFTAFSAQLSARGSEGAEIVARTISSLFSVLMTTLEDWNGSLLKLSGDALTAHFSGRDHARHALAAAFELQRRMNTFRALVTTAGVFTLQMRISLASGEVILAQIGNADRVELLVAGNTARRVMQLQRYTEPGAVAIDDATYSALGDDVQAATLGPGRYRVLAPLHTNFPEHADPIIWTPRRDPYWELHGLLARIESLRPYLVDPQLTRVIGGTPTLAGEGDLRPVTVLFASLSDAGELLEEARLADEATIMNNVQQAAQRLWDVVARHGGTVNKIDLHPDGPTLIALFGAPIAHGRDAERAVACAQALIHTLAARPDEVGPLRVRRIGIATGRVFAGAVGSLDRREYTVMGSVVNLAARLMSVAGDDQTLVDVATMQVAGQRFRLIKQPPALIKGYDEPVPFFTLGNEQRSRLSNMLRNQEPLVGRNDELARASAAVGAALRGPGTVIALAGDAGIGKSRLLAEIVRSTLSGRTATVAIALAQAQPQSRTRPYGLIADVLRQLFHLSDDAQTAAAELATRVGQYAPSYGRFTALLPILFGLPSTQNAIADSLTPDERRTRLHDMLHATLQAHVAEKPTALVLEDLHWIDTSSRDILDALVADLSEHLVLLCTYRNENAPEWPDTTRLTLIELGPMTLEQSQVLITTWLGARSLSSRLRASVVERTQGNPFFIAETVRALRERDLAAGGDPLLPATIQSALLGRVDRLPLEDRYALQVAAILGPTFDAHLLAGVAGKHIATERALERLASHGLVREAGGGNYAFMHHLTHETVYESMLFAQRRQLHREAADRLHEDPERADSDPAALAYHYERAEAWPETLEYAVRAGMRAQALYAGDVALDHFKRALEAAERFASPEAAQQRPMILKRVGDLHALAGRNNDAIAAFEAALDSAMDEDARADILICWAEVAEGQASYDEALGLLQRAAAQTSDAASSLNLRVAARRGWVLVRSGDAERARAAVEPYLEQLEVRKQWQDLVLVYKVFFHLAMGQSRWSEARSYLRLGLVAAERTGDIREIARLHNNIGIVLTQEGDLRGAAAECQQAAETMREIGDQNTLASIEVNIGVIYYKLGEFATAFKHYDASLQIATTISAVPIESIVRSNLGEIERRMGHYEASLEQLLQSVALCEQINDDIGLTEAYRQLAETYIKLERLADAEIAASQALEWALVAEDAQAEAIAQRVRGQLAAARGDDVTALESLQLSVQMLAELGSAHELGQSLVVQSEVWRQVGRFDHARASLAEAILLFQQTGATADLADAQSVILTANVEDIGTGVSL